MNAEERFRGGPLAGAAWELDAMYYGTVFENNRLMGEWTSENARHRVWQLAQGESPEDLPRPRLLDTTAWITLMHLIEDAAGMPGNANPFKAVNFRLDVLRALSKVPASRLRAIVHYMDGYSLEEIAELMPPDDGRPWERSSVRAAVKQGSRTCRRHGDAIEDEPTRTFTGVPRTETARQVEERIESIRAGRDRVEARRRATKRRAA